MTNLAKILLPERVILDLDVSNKEQMFETVCAMLKDQCSIAQATLAKNLLEREALGSTALGYGVAVPHGRIKGLKAPMAAFVRLKEPIPFDAPDEQPVKLLIFVLIPDNVTQQHLEILSEIAEMFSNSEFRAVLAAEMDPEKVYVEIQGWRPGKHWGA